MSRIVSPITGELIREVQSVDPAEVPAIFDRAARAFESWRRVPASERARQLFKVASIMRERGEEVAQLETLNTGKLLADTRREADRAAACFEYYAGWADKVTGTTIGVPGPFHAYTLREPHGVSLGIIPWNVPYFFAAKKIAPALAFGNTVVLKPAEETPLTALLLAEVLQEAGLPDDVAQVVPGGAQTGRALVESGRADIIVFTGSDLTGRVIARSAADHLIPVTMELGGKSPQIVFPDADIDAALNAVVMGAFGSTGQMCIAGSRLLLHTDIHDEFVEQVAERVSSLKVGDPRAEGVHLGPQVTEAQRDKTLAMIESGVDEGARVIASANLPSDPSLAEGYFAPPTVFADVEVGMEIMQREIFGPVLAVTRFNDEAEAIELAHATDFGLAAGVWTRDVGRSHRLASELNVGTVWLNTYRVLSDLVPFGGIGFSGYGREGGTEAVNLYTRVKSVWTSLESGLPPGYSMGN